MCADMQINVLQSTYNAEWSNSGDNNQLNSSHLSVWKGINQWENGKAHIYIYSQACAALLALKQCDKQAFGKYVSMHPPDRNKL